jgi:hypothetical protein
MVSLYYELFRVISRGVRSFRLSLFNLDLVFSSFPFDIPTSTKVPHWAYLDVVVSSNAIGSMSVSSSQHRETMDSHLRSRKQLSVRDFRLS